MRIFDRSIAAPRGLGAEIKQAALARAPLAQRDDTTAFRIVHTGEVSLPGLAIDRYHEHAVAHFSSPEATARASEIAALLVDLGFRGVYAKFRPRQASTLVDTRRDEVAPRLPLAGDEAPEPTSIVELGDPFVVRLGDGLSTGIFLDQRENRALVRSLSSGRRVLNLFAYACAFTVSAARGGASRVVSVDISKTSLAWGEDNLRLSGLLDPARFRFVADEALTYLRRCLARGDRFDLILLDPPSFATTKTARFSAEHDYRTLATAAFSVLAPGGSLLACTNHRGITQPQFRGFLMEAAEAARAPRPRLRFLPPPTDFPEPSGTEPYLKAALLSL